METTLLYSAFKNQFETVKVNEDETFEESYWTPPQLFDFRWNHWVIDADRSTRNKIILPRPWQLNTISPHLSWHLGGLIKINLHLAITKFPLKKHIKKHAVLLTWLQRSTTAKVARFQIPVGKPAFHSFLTSFDAELTPVCSNSLRMQITSLFPKYSPNSPQKREPLAVASERLVLVKVPLGSKSLSFASSENDAQKFRRKLVGWLYR